MDCKNLMIGDWVRLIKSSIPFLVDAIYDGEVNLVTHKGCDSLTFLDTALEPIPLTPEILEKNGFENDFYEEESVADYHTIRLEGYSLKSNIGEINGYLVTWCNGGVNVTTDFCGCIQKDISFVHELQHALKLCGIEKEIEL